MEQTHIIQKKIYPQVSSLHYFNILPNILIMDYYAFSQQIWSQTNLSKLNNNASFQRLAKKLKIQTQKYTLGTNWRSDTLWMTKELTDGVGGRLTDKWLTV